MIGRATSILPLALLLLAAPAGAQEEDPNWRLCRAVETAEAQTLVDACSALLRSARLTDRERAEALSSRAIAYRVQEDHARALADYDAALAIDPDFDWAHHGRGAVFRDRGDPALAIPEYDEGIRLGLRDLAAMEPRSEDHIFYAHRLAWGYFGRALAYARLRDHRRAVTDLREAVSRAPEDPDMANALCWSLAVSGGDLDEARAACDASLRIRPNDGRTLDSRGMVGLKQGRFQQAWNDYDAAVRTGGPALPTFLYGRGIAALRLGRTEEGRADLARATALNAELPQFYAGYGLTPNS